MLSDRSQHSRGWTFAIVSAALFMVVLDNLVVTTALPSIRADLGATIQSLEWTVNAYTLSYAVLLLTGAALGDRFGRKRMFVIGLALFTTASAAAALAPSTSALIGARALQGVGAAIVTPLTLTLLAEVFPAEKRGLAIGGWTSTPVLGSLVAGAALVVAFLIWEARTEHPMLPLRFFRSRGFAAVNVVSLSMYFGVFGSIFLLAQFFQVTHGYSPLEAGLRTLPWTGMPMLVAPVAGLLSDRIGSRPLMATGLALQAAAIGGLASVSTPTVP